MRTASTVDDVRRAVTEARRGGARVGFVPTMGFLHEGHLRLVDAARRASDFVVMSIFVNPLQFAPTEDLARYPRDPEGDAAKAEERGVDLLFTPSVEEMYATQRVVSVTATRLDRRWEGEIRPGHFAGMLTVVCKLFNIVQPDVAVFGQKDFQQAALVRAMVRDLDIPVTIAVAPIVREPDGLAMSSRNRNLTAAEREAATVIFRGLQSGADVVAAGERDASKLRRVVANVLTTEPLVRLEYAEVVAADTLAPLEQLEGEVLVAVAARVGGVRLIDNMTIRVDAQGAVADLGIVVAPAGEGLCAAR
jgi:pantoate--beta-alanine ligase